MSDETTEFLTKQIAYKLLLLTTYLMGEGKLSHLRNSKETVN